MALSVRIVLEETLDLSCDRLLMMIMMMMMIIMSDLSKYIILFVRLLTSYITILLFVKQNSFETKMLNC
jgi:hypothetical protein